MKDMTLTLDDDTARRLGRLAEECGEYAPYLASHILSVALIKATHKGTRDQPYRVWFDPFELNVTR